MKKLMPSAAIAGIFVLAGACSSPAPPSRSSGMCQVATDAGVLYFCSTLTNLTSTALTANCAAPGQFTPNQSCPTANPVGTCTVTFPANGASIVDYFYAPNTCEAAKTSCNSQTSTVAAGTTITFSGNGC